MSISEKELAEKFAALKRSRTDSPGSPSEVKAAPEPTARPCECGRGERKPLRLPLTGNVVWSECPACAEKKEAREREEAERRREQERADAILHRAETVEENLARMGVTRKYRNVSLETFDPSSDKAALREAVEFVGRFRGGERPSLYLFSERDGERIAPGCGKTHLAVGILRALALDPAVPLSELAFAFVPKLLLEMQATFKNPDRSELEIVEKYAKPELLVWDDFGAEKLSDFAARTLYTILYEREGKSNVFTSNLSLGAIENRDPTGYTQRITSRIAGDARYVCLTGPDRRIRVA